MGGRARVARIGELEHISGGTWEARVTLLSHAPRCRTEVKPFTSGLYSAVAVDDIGIDAKIELSVA